MGIKVGKILDSKFFKDFTLLAGKSGLDREIQAVVLFDAPDGYRWFSGKEFILSSGYLFMSNMDLLREVIVYTHGRKSAAIGIKTQRFLKEIPQEIIQLCDELGMPFIEVPEHLPWTTIINEVNSIAINSFISKVVNSPFKESYPLQSGNFNDRIKQILRNLSKEINLPITFVSILDKNYFSYPPSTQVQRERILYKSHYDPNFNYHKEILDDRLDIFRITSTDGGSHHWIVVPIRINRVVIAYLLIWEGNHSIDYYDLFAIRLSYAMISGFLEQLHSIHSLERKLYDNFIKKLVEGELDSKEKVISTLDMLPNIHLDTSSRYIIISILMTESSFYEHIGEMHRMSLLDAEDMNGIYGLYDDHTLLILLDICNWTSPIIEKAKNKCGTILQQLLKYFPHTEFKLGIGDPVDDILEVKKSYVEAMKSIEIGKYLYPEKDIIAFEDLGPFGLFRLENIQRKSFGSNFKYIEPLFKEEDAEDLLNTLRAYLACNSNYNNAAKKLFIHSNTVRYRIAKVQRICNIDLQDSMERLKTEVALKFIDKLKCDLNKG